MSFAPSRVLVTGATGFVGRHLLAALRAAFPAAELVPAGRTGESAGGAEGAAPVRTTAGCAPASMRAIWRAKDATAKRGDWPGPTWFIGRRRKTRRPRSAISPRAVSAAALAAA